jgi:RNA polymerase sigma factor (sigma-70 family)
MVIQHLLAAIREDGPGMTDGELLNRFLHRRDGAAVAALVRRHAPMVWGVCRRVLHSHHDAEDAFQATFLVLVRKAVTIRDREKVAHWLYGVAHQTAVRLRATLTRRKLRERQVAEMPEPAPTEPAVWSDLRPLLDAELSRLPDKYRVVLVLCDLEDKTRKEASRQLGLPEGTVASRLMRARMMLARRLTRRGVIVSGGALAGLLSRDASAGVPALVMSATIKAATLFATEKAAATGAVSVQVVALTEGVLKAMLMSKFKPAIIAVLATALLGLGGGVFAWRSQESEYPAGQVERETKPRGKADNLKKQLLELDELWWKGDVETLRRLAADDLVTVSGVGRYDKSALLAAARHRHPVDGVRRDVEVIRVSKDVAVVTYRYDCQVVLRDGTLFQNCRDRRFSMTWVNRKGRWVVVFAQETILPGGE